MKKIVSCLALAALLLPPVSALAQGGGGFTGKGAKGVAPAGGGFTGPTIGPMKVVDVVSLWDDTPVYLEGKIIQSFGGERYQFTDGTGTVLLEIDDDDWQGVTVGPKDTIGIWGEIDKDWNSVKVEVDRILKK